MRILITGGSGYLGGRLSQFLAKNTEHEILIASRQNQKSPDWLPQAQTVQIQWGEPGNLDKICSNVDAVIHLAGMNAQDCSKNPVEALQVNGVLTAKLLKSAVRQNIKRFIYLSTAHVYASPLNGTISENTCAVNWHPYATSHRAGEDVVRYANQRGEIEGIVIRLSNAYGAPAHKDANCWMLLMNDLCMQAVYKHHIVLHSSGKQRRDFVSLHDACRAINHLLDLKSNNIDDGLFNVGGEWSPSILDISKIVAERYEKITSIKPTIYVPKDGAKEMTDNLDYQILKLKNTGFNLSNREIFHEEIDNLIRFCMEIKNKA